MLERVEPLGVLEVHELDELLLLGVEEHLWVVPLLVAQSRVAAALVVVTGPGLEAVGEALVGVVEGMVLLGGAGR